MIVHQRNALTELMQRHVGTGKPWSTRAFAARAVDPASGYAPSGSLVGKIIAGDGYRVSPELVSALAVGLCLPRQVVAAAAHFQIIGYEPNELEEGPPATVVKMLDAASEPLSSAVDFDNVVELFQKYPSDDAAREQIVARWEAMFAHHGRTLTEPESAASLRIATEMFDLMLRGAHETGQITAAQRDVIRALLLTGYDAADEFQK